MKPPFLFEQSTINLRKSNKKTLPEKYRIYENNQNKITILFNNSQILKLHPSLMV